MYSQVLPISANISSVSLPTRRFATSLIAMHTYIEIWELSLLKSRKVEDLDTTSM